MAESQDVTDDSGQYSFTGLRAGSYSVEISGFDTNEVSFSSTSGAATVGVGESKVVSFDGTYLRTAEVQGQVSVDGEGLGGVTVTLMGQGAEESKVTDAGGLYAFSKLKSGTYTVAISGYDTDDYEFETTSKSVTIATGEVGNVLFDGTLLRTAGIAGRVSVEGMGLDGVTVTLAGAAEATTETLNGGQYAFAGLAAGTYVLSIENPNETAYKFDEMELQKTVELADDESEIVNFSGTHTRTAVVKGLLFIDEVDKNKTYDDGEPSITEAIAPLVAAGALDAEVVAGLLAKAKVILRGPDLNTTDTLDINADGTFSTGETLPAGSYQVELPVNDDDDVAAGLAAVGVAFVGGSEVVKVEAGDSETVNFPFRITMQTLIAGACLGAGECLAEDGAVEGVELTLYANADETGMLGEPQMTDENGMAMFHFARADNTGPAGNDHIVFVKATGTGHGALAFSGNNFTEVSYASTARVSQAPAAVTLVNVMANFQFWVKSDADAVGGDMGLGGWQVQYCMPMAKTDDADEVVCTGDDAAFTTIMVGEGDDAEPAVTDDGEMEMADLGKGTFAKAVHPKMLPAMFYVRVTPVDAEGESVQPDGGETWSATDLEPHVHTGLVHPDANTADMNDLGPTYITWSTQKLTVGVYREVDDEPGWTNYRAPMGGDGRPVAAVAGEMRVELMTRDERLRLRTYNQWDHDRDAKTDPVDAILPVGAGGTVSFANLDANKEFTARLHVGGDRTLVGETDIGDVDAFGDDLELGTSQGSFGKGASGAGPEVKLCSVSEDMEKKCATWAYQWTTGSVSGSVAGPGGATVNLTAETNARDRDAKTGADATKASFRKFAISDIQDGGYTLTTPNTADNKFSPKDGFEDLEIYHNEMGEKAEDDESEYVGTAYDKDDADFTATKLRLSIKGYVANDGNGDDRARGNESMAGVDLRLLEIAEDGVSKNLKDTTFVEVNTTTTNGGGFYEFNELEEGKTYFVEVPDGDTYVGLYTGIGNNKSGGVNPDTYPALNEGTFDLPKWVHASNETEYNSVPVSAPAPSTVSANLVNFALVYTTSNLSGTVYEASEDDVGIIVEAAICREYTAADANASPPVVEDCDWQREDLVSTRTVKGGDFEFPGLMEGYYEVWYTGGGLTAAKLNTEGKMDDDVTDSDADDADLTNGTRSPTKRINSVMGRNQYSTGNDFHVYNNRSSDANALTSLKVEGFTSATATEATDFADGADITQTSGVATQSVSLTGATITWAAAGVTITTEQSTGASASAFLTTKVDNRSTSNLPYNETGGANAGTDLTNNITVRVTAANGYDDHDYTFDVVRTAPEGNTPTSITADGSSVTWADGTFHNEDVVTANASADIVVDLTNPVGLPSLQSLSVTVGGNAVTCVAGTIDSTQHTCTVSGLVKGGQTAVKVEITSEDDVAASMIINLRRAAS